MIGEQLGQNLNNVLPGAIQQGYNRQLGLNALDQAKTEIADAKGDPYKMALAFARLGIASPENSNLQRAMGPLLQTALSNSTGAGTGTGLTDVSGGVPSPTQPSLTPDQNLTAPIAQESDRPQPRTAEGPKLPPSDIQGIANQYIGVVRPDLVNPATEYGAINTFNSAIKQDLTPQEEGQLRQQLTDKYKNQNVVENVIGRVREGVKNRYNEALAKYGFDQDRLNQIREKWKDFTSGTPQRLSPHLGKFTQEGLNRTTEALQNKYNEYAGNSTSNMTPEQMHTNAMALLQKDIDKIDALHAQPSMPPVRTEKGVADYLEQNKKQYKDLVNEGFIDAVREDALLKKDMGNEEFHSLIWGDQTSKPFLNSIHAIKAPEEYSGKYSGTKKYNHEYPKQHEKYISELSNRLLKMSPEDDLVLTRAMVLDAGGDIKDFNKALAMAESQGLKLSEFQKSQLQETNIPRVPPLWELFSEGGPKMNVPYIGEVKFLNWGPFINYLRGKK